MLKIFKQIHHKKFIHKTPRKTKISLLLPIDADGLSHYTAYLALGLSKYKKIILCGMSYEDYVVTGAIREKKIKFYNIGDKLPKRISIISRLFIYPLTLFTILFRLLITTKYDIVQYFRSASSDSDFSFKIPPRCTSFYFPK